jgi:hypothetical protein
VAHAAPTGRMSAKADLMSYCILTEADLTGTDQAIRDTIQDARSQWTRNEFEGKKAGLWFSPCRRNSPQLLLTIS